MHRIQLNQDIRPLSEFRANVATFIEQVHKTNRPMVITHHGRGTAVLLNVDDYEAMVEELELRRDIGTAEKQIREGKVVPHEVAMKRLRKKWVK